MEFYDLASMAQAAAPGSLGPILVEMNRVKHGFLTEQVIGADECLENLTRSTMAWMNIAQQGAVAQDLNLPAALTGEGLDFIAEAYKEVTGYELAGALDMISR